MEDAHAPRGPHATPATTLQRDTLVRVIATGEEISVDAWVQRHMHDEGRDYEPALEEAVNAVGRGDLVIVNSEA